jgi:glutathione S-transferase
MSRVAARFNNVTDEVAKADLAALPAMIDRVDRYISEGVMGGDQPNAADFQIAPSLRLLMCLDDIRPAIEGRPCAELATGLVSNFPGRVPPVLPAEWLAPLRGAAVTAA